MLVQDLLNTLQNSWYLDRTLLMSTRVVSKSLGSNVETNNLYTCTSANREAHANAAAPIKDILVAEFGVPEAEVTSSGGTKDSVSFGGRNEMLPNTQSIHRLLQVSQLCPKTAKQLTSNGVM